MDETFIRKSTNLCKSKNGIDASQFYPYSICPLLPTGLHTRWRRWEYESEIQRFTPRQNKSRFFKNMVLSYFLQLRLDCETESNVTTGRQKKNDCFSVAQFSFIVGLFLKLSGVIITIFLVEKHELL